MKLAVDARLMAGHPRGMGQYARALVTPLNQQLTALLPQRQLATEWPSLSSGSGFFPWWEQRVLPKLAMQCGATHLLCPSNTGPMRKMSGIRTIIVVHDLIFLSSISELPLSRSIYQNLGRAYRRAVVPTAARCADVLVTVSQFTRHEICERFDIPLERIHVIPNTVHEGWFVETAIGDHRRNREILCVSGEGPSKNLSGFLKAFARMRESGVGQDLNLRIVGVKTPFHGDFQAEAHALGLEGKVTLERYVAEDELQRMYREAWAFVLPSLQEGFGIPLLEAMASGTPVACSNTTSMPEVAGGHAWLFNPRDIDSMAEGLASAVSSPERQSRVAAGLAHAHQYRRSVVQPSIESFWEQVA